MPKKNQLSTDEVYDEMERTKEEEKSVKKVEKKAKYIENLLKTADLRKKEQELRKERVIQKEIEAEEAMFSDKERYITSSYKKKLEEMKQFEEEQKNQDRLEAIGDVVKQKDISGFYRHLYRQTVEKNDADCGIKPEGCKVQKEEHHSGSDKSNKSDDEKVKKQRQYRKRANTESESESDQESDKQKVAIKKQKIEEKEITEKEKLDEVKEKDAPEKLIPPKDDILKPKESQEQPIEKSEKDNVREETKENNPKKNNTEIDDKPKPEPKKKVNIYKKRTVGSVFQAALERYLKRKEDRLGLEP